MQRRDTWLCAGRIDAPIRRPEVARRGVDCRVRDVDADPRWHLDGGSVDEDIEMRMDVVIEELVGLRLEAGGGGEIERLRWRWPGHPTRRRLGGGLRLLNLG